MTTSSTSTTVSGPAHVPSKTAIIWLTVSSIIVAWDIGYILFRPYSMKGLNGALSFLWPGYQLYERIDNVYSVQAWKEHRGWPLAETYLNVVENFINYTYLRWALTGDAEQNALAPLVGLTGVLMTLSKTVLYFLNDYLGGWAESGHNSWLTWLTLYVGPNIFWVIFPGILTYRFWLEVAGRLRLASATAASSDVASHDNGTKAKST